MADHYDIETAKTRIGRVFRYLQELHRVKTPPIVDLERYEWGLKLESLPNYDSIQRGTAFGNIRTLKEGSPLHDGGFLFKVGRPKETECPPPSVVIEQWLKPGWQNATTDPDQAESPDEETEEQQIPDPIAYYRLDGTASLKRSRFLHLEFDLQMRSALWDQTMVEESLDDAIENESPRPSSFLVHSLQQSRQVRSGRMEYFDGPVLSVLAYITTIKAEEEDNP